MQKKKKKKKKKHTRTHKTNKTERVANWKKKWLQTLTKNCLLGLCGKVLVAGHCRGGFCDKNPEAVPC